MPTILTINSGSSSVKASLFGADGSRRDFFYGHLRDPRSGFDHLLRDLQGHAPDIVGHRFVHGGDISDAARVVDDIELARLRAIVPLAPLHLPGNLLGIELCRERFAVPQVACFDTAFHFTLPEIARRLPIPASYGMRRYGFHGLNYAHVASVLPALLGDPSRGNVIVAHLGSGASLCLLRELKSQDTTMGYTPAGGIVMGTRSGDLDPGVMLELAQRHDVDTLRDIVFHQMGLLALSDGEGSEMRDDHVAARGVAQQRGQHTGNMRIVQTVKTVAAHSILGGDRQPPGDFRQGRMKSGIEAGDLRHGKAFAAQFDAQQIARQVQRRKRHDGL